MGRMVPGRSRLFVCFWFLFFGGEDADMFVTM